MNVLIITVHVHGGKESHKYEFDYKSVVEINKDDITVICGVQEQKALTECTTIIPINKDDIIEIKVGKYLPWN